MVRQASQTTVHPGFVLPAAGVNVLLMADSPNLFEASWIERRFISTLDLGERLNLTANALSLEFASWLPTIAAVWSNGLLLLLVGANKPGLEGTAIIYPLRTWNITVDLPSLAESVLRTYSFLLTSTSQTTTTTSASISTTTLYPDSGIAGRPDTVPTRELINTASNQISSTIIAVSASCAGLLVIVLLLLYWLCFHRPRVSNSSDLDKFALLVCLVVLSSFVITSHLCHV
jgi:hypothetical protein